MNQLFGMELPEGTAPRNVASSLGWMKECKYDFCELSLSGFPLVVEGRVNWVYVEYLKPLLTQSGLRFTAHIGTGLELREGVDHAVHRNTLFSSLDICAALGAEILTVHFEQASPKVAVEAQFLQIYREAAQYALEKGVLLCMENIEVEDYRRVLVLLDAVDSPGLRMTLDLGHLYLATRYFGGEYFSALADAAPYAAHVHLHDNTGTYEPMRLQDFARYKQLGLNERIAFGRGDLHLPVFWGTLPVTESLQQLQSRGYTGSILLECGGALYEPFYGEMLAKTKAVLENSRA